jgi:hypothetical protein
VKVYVLVPATDVEIVAGLHVPEIPLFEMDGNVGATPLRHNGPMLSNTGTIPSDVTLIFIVKTRLHWPAFGLNVYVVVPVADVFTTAGLHEPVMPFPEVAGNIGAVLFKHKGPTGTKSGVIDAATVTLKVTMGAQDIDGVKV